MSDEITPSGQPDLAGGNQPNTQDTVAYSSYQKLLTEKKRRDQENEALRKQLESVHNEKLEAEGNKDEVIANLRAQNQKLESDRETDRNKFRWSKVEARIREEATRRGCTNPDALLKLIDDEDLDKIQVDERFNVDTQSLSSVMDVVQKKNTFVFGKEAKPVRDLPISPGGGVPPASRTSSALDEAAQLSSDQIISKLRDMSTN